MTTKPKTRREILTENKNWLNFYARSSDKKHEFTVPIPPKRHRVKRPVDGQKALTEYQEQGLVIEWWFHAHGTYGLPIFALFSIPNGAYLASGYMGAAMLKKAGMRPGAPDLFLAARNVPKDYLGCFIELKSANGRESPEQQQFGQYLVQAGYYFTFAYGAEQAVAAIKDYLGAPSR